MMSTEKRSPVMPQTKFGSCFTFVINVGNSNLPKVLKTQNLEENYFNEFIMFPNTIDSLIKYDILHSRDFFFFDVQRA